MSGYPQRARVLFAVLTECESGKGNRYMRGWAGASNLVAFRGEDDEQGRPTWNLYLAERQPRQESRPEPSQPRGAASRRPQPPARAAAAPAARSAPARRSSNGSRQDRIARDTYQRYGSPALDDEIPFG